VLRGGFAEQRLGKVELCVRVRQEDDRLRAGVLGEPSDLVAAALPILVEVAQVHQHGVAAGNEPVQRGLPGVAMAEELVDSEPSIRVLAIIPPGEALV